MKTEIWCDQCKSLVASVDEEPALVAAILFACHVNAPHCGHPVRVKQAAPPSPTTWRIRVVCIKCKTDGVISHDFLYEVPPEFASAAVVAFHSSHEGHAVELYLDGGAGERRVHPPVA